VRAVPVVTAAYGAQRVTVIPGSPRQDRALLLIVRPAGDPLSPSRPRVRRTETGGTARRGPHRTGNGAGS